MATTPVIAWVRDPKDNQLASGSYSLSAPSLGTKAGTLSATGPSLRVDGVTCGEVVTLTLTITGQPAPLTVYRRVPTTYAASPWRRPWLPAAPLVPFDLGVQVGYFDPQEVGKDMATGSAGGGSVAGAGSNVVVKDELGVWSLTKAQADAAHTAGAKLLWYGTPAPTAAEGVAYLDVVNGTVSTANKPTPPPVDPPPAPTSLTVSYSGASWDKTPAQVSAARAASQTVSWVGTTVLPTTADGLAEGDAVSGTFTQPAPTRPLAKISIPTWAVPTAIDGDQSANDKVALSTYLGLTYTVNGVDYTTGQQVATGGVASVPVSVKVTDPTKFALLESTSAWTLNFNTTDTWIASIDSGSIPIASDQGNTASDTITITSVPGVIWTVDGVDYPSSGFTGTQVIPYTKGVNTTVTARAAAGYQFRPSVTTSWFLQFTSVGTVLTSSNMANYSNGTSFTENDGAGVPFTMNNYYGGTQTIAWAKYCNITTGNLVLQDNGSFFIHPVAAIGATCTMEWTHRAQGGSGDTYMLPMYKDATGLGWGARVASDGMLGGGKIANWSLGNQGYASGTATAVAAGDVIRLVATSTSMTAYINGTQVWTYNFASMTDNTSALMQIGAILGTSYQFNNYKYSRS